MNAEGVRALIKQRIKELRTNQIGFGYYYGFAKQTVYDFTSGRRDPSKKLLKVLGLRRVVSYEPIEKKNG